MVGWENTMVTGVSRPENKQYVGLTVTQIAEKMGKDPYDAAYDLLISERCNVGMINFISDEADNQRIIQKDYCSIISDSLYAEGGLPASPCVCILPQSSGYICKRAACADSGTGDSQNDPAAC